MAENNRIAVCLHLYYAEQLPDMLKYLRNLRQSGVPYDLYVSLPEPREEIEQALRAAEPAVEIWHPANRGYDIGPFIDFLHKIELDSYDYIIKIHTKNTNQGNYTILNNRRFDNKLWGKVLREALLGSPDQIKQNYAKFSEDDTIAMLGSKYCLTSEKHAYQSLLEQIKSEMVQLNLPQTDKVEFIAGTMFMVRAKLLKPFLQINISDFAQTDGRIKEGTKAHVYERLFGCAVLAQGKRIEGIKQYHYGKEFLKARIKRFFYQKKRSKSGKIIIKICKLPVLNLRSK